MVRAGARRHGKQGIMVARAKQTRKRDQKVQNINVVVMNTLVRSRTAGPSPARNKWGQQEAQHRNTTKQRIHDCDRAQSAHREDKARCASGEREVKGGKSD